MKRTMLTVVILMCGASIPAARAQYRNNIFALGGGYSFLAQEMENLQISGAPMLGGETLFKMMSDHWWFSVRVHLGIRHHLDEQADEAIGTLLEVKPGIAVRYLFLTDRLRPYLQVGASYSKMWSFKNTPAADFQRYLPHTGWGTLNLQPGIEFVFRRNTAIQLAVDVERMLIWSGDDGWTLFFNLQINFYL